MRDAKTTSGPLRRGRGIPGDGGRTRAPRRGAAWLRGAFLVSTAALLCAAAPLARHHGTDPSPSGMWKRAHRSVRLPAGTSTRRSSATAPARKSCEASRPAVTPTGVTSSATPYPRRPSDSATTSTPRSLVADLTRTRPRSRRHQGRRQRPAPPEEAGPRTGLPCRRRREHRLLPPRIL